MKNLLICFSLVWVSTLVACQGVEKETIREVVREQGQQNGEGRAEGGADSGGGGSGVNGKPLEAYAVSLKKVSSFKNLVMPIILKIQEAHPRFASDMTHIAINRKWYFIPVDLNKLPAESIGVSFGDKDLQQLALQNLNAVWLDSKVFDREENSEDDRATLILHEIIMGIRLMSYKSALDNCYSEVAYLALKDEDARKHGQSRDKCALTYGLGSRDRTGGIKLSKEDYDAIRELVIELWNNKGEISKVQLDAWLEANQFRKY